MTRQNHPGNWRRTGPSRRGFIGAIAGFGLIAAGCDVSGSAEQRPSASAEVESAVSNGLNFLDRRQSRDGWTEADPDGGVATAARALLAFLAAGHVPDVGGHGLAVRRTIEWLLGRQIPQGWFGPPDRGLRPHVTATTALSQAYGVETNADHRLTIHNAVGKAFQALLNRQVLAKSPSQPGGGWGSDPAAARSQNLPTTAFSLFSLRACADIGFTIPQPVYSRAVDFTLRCFEPSTGGFGAAPGEKAQLRSTCAGVLALSYCNATVPNVDKLDAAKKFVLAHAADVAVPETVGLIVPLAALKLGNDVWSAVAQPLMARIVKSQDKDGGWPGAKPAGRPEVTRAAATASALSALTICSPLLPIYQR